MLGRKKDEDNAAKPAPVEAAPTVEDKTKKPAYATEPAAPPASTPGIPPVPEISRRLADIPPISRPSDNGSVSRTENKRLTVGKEIEMSGDITACDTLIVEGTMDANLRDGREISIARGGRFIGSAEVDEADVSGNFSGRLVARQRLIVRSGGKVDGEIYYGKIEVEPGGEVTGKLAVGDGHSGEIAALTGGAGEDDAASGQG
jgi:cytoskeletal protein CcmA (bactofilin family)